MPQKRKIKKENIESDPNDLTERTDLHSPSTYEAYNEELYDLLGLPVPDDKKKLVKQINPSLGDTTRASSVINAIDQFFDKSQKKIIDQVEKNIPNMSNKEKEIIEMIEAVKIDIKSKNLKNASIKLNQAMSTLSRFSAKEKDMVEIIEDAILDVKSANFAKASDKLNQVMISISEFSTVEKEVQKPTKKILPRIYLPSRSILKRIYTTKPLSKHLEILIPLIIGFIAYTPRMPQPAEYDSFYVIYQAQLILRGYLLDWIIHPASIFGLYPFSGYPIGSSLLFSIFLLLSNNSVPRAVFIFSIFILCLMVVSTTLFLNEITRKKSLILIGNIFYVLTPILYEFSYFTTSARMMIFILAPLYFCFLLKWKKNRQKKNLGTASILVFSMFLFHRISMAFAVLLILTIVFIILFDVWKRFMVQKPDYALKVFKVMIVFQVLLIFISFLISRLIFGANFKNELAEVSIFKNFNPVLLEFLNYGFDYYQFWGPTLFCAFLGIFLFIFRCLKLDNSSLEYIDSEEFFPHLILFFCIVIMSPFFSVEAYSRHILIPILLPFSIYPMRYLMNREKLFQLFISFMYIVFLTFYTLYNLIWQGIGIYIYIVWSIFLIFLLFFVIDLFCRIIVDSKRLLYFLLKTTTKRKPNLRAITIEKFLSEVTEIVIASHRYVQLSFLLLLIALNSIILFDIKYLVVEDNRFPPSYASNEELEIVNYIKNSRVYSSETYFTLCSTHYLIETRIGAYAGILFLSDTSEVNLMITGYLDRSNVIQNSTLKPPTQWLEGPIFNYNTGYYYSYNEKEPLATKTFWRVVMRNPYNSSDAQKVIKAFNILFFVKLKESDIAYFRLGDTFLSPFAETIPENFIVYETNHLFLYQLPNS